MNDPTKRPPIPRSDNQEELSEELDHLLDAIDDILEEDPEEFVRNYVQKAGNGGGEYVEFFERWMLANDAERTGELLALVRLTMADFSVEDDLYDDGYDDFYAGRTDDASASSQNRDSIDDRKANGKDPVSSIRLILATRYGSCTADYFQLAKQSLPDISEMLRAIIVPIGSRAHGSERLSEYNRRLTPHLRLEASLRLSERRQDFVAARDALLRVEADEFKIGLRDEYKYLMTSSETELNDRRGGAYQIADLMRQIHCAIAPFNNLDVLAPHIETQDVPADHQTSGSSSSPRAIEPEGQRIRPHERGDILEEAALRVIRKLFALPSDEEERVLSRLRRQGPGLQYGHDIQFHAGTAQASSVRCRVECKNYGRPIELDHIAGKLLQQESADSASAIDHWILLSPHWDPNNALRQYLDEWSSKRRFPFEIQVWSPESGIKELFALEPSFYKAVYGSLPPEEFSNPNVLQQFRERLQPVPRIHPVFDSYLRDPWRLCFANEEASHFDDLFSNYVELEASDTAGRLSPIPLRDMVDGWMRQPLRTTFLLLADFGDGKSFFTYALCRELANEFLRSPKEAYFPLRMSLRELRSAGTAEEFLRRHMERLGVPVSALGGILRRNILR